MPINKNALAELIDEPVAVKSRPFPPEKDAQGRAKDDPAYDPFEDTAEEKAEFEKTLQSWRKGWRDYSEFRKKQKPKAVSAVDFAGGLPEGHSGGSVTTDGKRKPANHNPRTKAYYENLGMTFYKADYYDARSGRAHDLFGVFDGVAFGKVGIIGVQLTSKANMSARRKKIREWDGLKDWKAGGGIIHLIGWAKNKQGRWEETVEEI